MWITWAFRFDSRPSSLSCCAVPKGLSRGTSTRAIVIPYSRPVRSEACSLASHLERTQLRALAAACRFANVASALLSTNHVLNPAEANLTAHPRSQSAWPALRRVLSLRWRNSTPLQTEPLISEPSKEAKTESNKRMFTSIHYLVI